MAFVDYTGIAEAIESQVSSAVDFTDVERSVLYGPQEKDSIIVNADDYEIDPVEQRLSGGQLHLERVRYQVWCRSFHFDSREAARGRDKIMRDAAKELMKDKTLGGRTDVDWLLIQSGDFLSANAENDSAFLSLGSLLVEVRARATL